MSFGFDPDEKWNVSTDLWVPIGNHVMKVAYVETEKPSSGGHPMVEVRFEWEKGPEVAKDWIVISSPKTFGKFTSLVLAAGIPDSEYPKPGDDFDTATGAVKQHYAMKLLNREVGVVVRPRQDKPEQGEVKGYVLPGEITDEVPIDTRGLPAAGAPAASGSKGKKEKIPF
jgi:hypothetical protein